MNALDNWDVANAFDGVEEGHRPMTATLGVTMTWQGRTESNQRKAAAAGPRQDDWDGSFVLLKLLIDCSSAFGREEGSQVLVPLF